MKVIMAGTIVWSMATACTVTAFVLVTYIAFTADSLLQVEKGRLLALLIGLVPWLFAYAATRVMYGIETLMEG